LARGGKGAYYLMRKNQPPQPKPDFGFYAVIPRIIRTNYKKKLSPCQKWLYVCLKDLCGDSGTCYRTLRVLAEETGISTGLLSESIPLLHTLGLIHAEKKRRTAGGKEVWHITIVDIWQENGKEHPTTKCSLDEQPSENVHTVNNDVHCVNEMTGVCSPGERECSLCETEVIPYKQEHIEERKGEATQRSTVASSVKESPPSSFTKGPIRQSAGEEPRFKSAAASALHRAWVKTYGPYGEDAFDIQAFNWMADHGATFEDIQFLYTQVKKDRPLRPEAVKKNWHLLSERKKGDSGSDTPACRTVGGLRVFTMEDFTGPARRYTRDGTPIPTQQ